ncbi:hypothetical protein NM208_g7614 [Fusarium decemcellulare]|uniref:Uncharacterized protein n=1 Tax=Fusarium decemcellulare TaxID=57161 RepID=A0ACC1S8D6_9HYPO|nr:hypothetical protein NM208_g7614 [Fusarium decemcellulare]
MSLPLLKRYLPISVALLLYYGSASRFSHGATSTASFYQYQNERRLDDGSTEARLIPVFDFILATAILRPGITRTIGTCSVAATIGIVAVHRVINGLPCQGDVIQAIWTGLLESINSLTPVLGAASCIRVIAKNAAPLRRPLGDALTALAAMACRSSRALATTIAARVHAIDAAAFFVSKDSLSFGIDGFALVIAAASGVWVVAVDAAAFAQPAELGACANDGQTGASMGIGEAIAVTLAEHGINLALVSRSKDKLETVRNNIISKFPNIKVGVYPVDLQHQADVEKAVKVAVSEIGQIDILINNAGLALGAPGRFWELPIDQVAQMSGTNINGVMFTTHAVLNHSMWQRKKGTIINISSVTGLECPPFNGEAVYHASKAFLEGFTNSLRLETAGSDIRVLVLRPGCVETHFHLQRVKYDQGAMNEFFQGYEPLLAEDLAQSVLYMLSLPSRISIKALDCVPTAQRSLTRFDREWNSRRE